MRKGKKQHTSSLDIPVIFQPEPEGGFTVIVPSLSGCVTFGKDLDEARLMAQEAIALYLEDLADSGEDLPQRASAYMSNVNVVMPQLAGHV